MNERTLRWLVMSVALFCCMAMPATNARAQELHLPALHNQSGPALLYADDFNDSMSGWTIAENQNLRVRYVEGEYEILVKQETSALVEWKQKRFANFSFQADARLLPSEAAQNYGLALQFADDSGRLFFLVNEEAKFIVWTLIYGNTEILHEWQETAAEIRPSPAVNRLQIDYREGSYVVYINGKEVARGTCSAPPGDVGIAFVNSGAGGGFPAAARFDNVTVRALSN